MNVNEVRWIYWALVHPDHRIPGARVLPAVARRFHRHHPGARHGQGSLSRFSSCCSLS